MTVYVALLRAINVGGTGALAMKDLTALCAGLGFENPRTYIQSGNVVFGSPLPADDARGSLERAVSDHMGKKADVIVREAGELRRVLEANPFPDASPSKVAVVFSSRPVHEPPAEEISAPGGEEVVFAAREIYIHYPNGMGRSKLKFPASDAVVTVRNVNTLTKLVAMAGAALD